MMKIEHKPKCYLCKGKHSRNETNRHARLYCTHYQIQQERKLQGEKVKQNVATYNGTEILQDIMQQMYDNNDKTEREREVRFEKSE